MRLGGRARPPVPGGVATALAALGVVATGAAAARGRDTGLDRRLGRWLARPRGRAVDRLVGVATDLGSVYGLTGLSAVLAAAGRPRVAARVAVAGGVAWGAAQVVKPLVDRPRPYEGGIDRLVAVPAGSSWPSGHTAVAAAMAAALWPRLGTSARAASAGLVAGVAASRCYVGVHHPSDVVAGAGVGVLSARLAAAATRARAAPRRS